MSALARLLGTFFYFGYFPKGPGTAGSLGALAIASALHTYLGTSGACIALFGALLIAPSIWAAGRMAKDTGSKDPQIVVIDEVVGQWIALAGASTLNWKSWLAAFALFRLFDIWKPPPVRQLEKIPGGAGIVLDDAMAGIYAALVLYFAGWFNLY
ncbi:MAG: phosphatidylglycerophosphatase A [Acidobacteriia bacterium]|nr:phosphatidylglycerophosphatase A [Terriglobia bacterium]